MKQTHWTYCAVLVLLVQTILITNSTPFARQLTSRKHKNKLKFDNVAEDAITHKTLSGEQMDKNTTTQQQNNSSSEVENVVVGQQGRFMASYFFPIFPQFYDMDYGAALNWLKRADTIGYFLFEGVGDVSVIFHRQYSTGVVVVSSSSSCKGLTVEHCF